MWVWLLVNGIHCKHLKSYFSICLCSFPICSMSIISYDVLNSEDASFAILSVFDCYSYSQNAVIRKKNTDKTLHCHQPKCLQSTLIIKNIFLILNVWTVARLKKLVSKDKDHMHYTMMSFCNILSICIIVMFKPNFFLQFRYVPNLYQNKF